MIGAASQLCPSTRQYIRRPGNRYAVRRIYLSWLRSLFVVVRRTAIYSYLSATMGSTFVARRAGT